MVDAPDLTSSQENRDRAKLLGYRGYKQNTLVFSGFPGDVEWHTALLDAAGQESLKVLNEEPWIRFSGGSRMGGMPPGTLLMSARKDEAAAIVGVSKRMSEWRFF